MDERGFQKYLENKIKASEIDVILNSPYSEQEGNFKFTCAHLIKICDDFIAGQLVANQIESIADGLIVADYFDLESEKQDEEKIDKVIYDWDSPDLNFEINIKNIKLWRDYLMTGNYNLPAYNIWDFHINDQKSLCEKFAVKWFPINPKSHIGLADNILNNPVHGLRHPGEKDTVDWFIWTEEYDERDDFFKPVCAEHLLDYRPEIIKYLGLPAGYRFLIDKNGYEDIWYDEKLLENN